MSKRTDVRAAISALLDAGESPTEISKTLKVSRPTIYRIKNIKEKGGDPISAKIPARKRPVLTSRVLGGLRKRIRSAPTKSLRRVAGEAGVNRETVRKMVRNS